MRIGISITSAYPDAEPREGPRQMLARARAAERAGLDSLFVGDHHVTPRPYYQNTAMLGRLLAEWCDRPCGALYLLPLWHPVLLAEQVATLASIATGPFILQCAIGPADAQFSGLGVDPKHRPSRFEQSLDILRRLWAGDTVSSAGRWSFDGARISPTPPEPVEVWIGATAEPAIDRAARLGDGWIASPHLIPAKAEAKLRLYRERCQAHGRLTQRATIRRDIYVGATADEAAAIAGPVVEAGYRGLSPEALVVGSPAQVASAFAQLAEMGYDDVLVRNLVPDPDEAVASIERLEEVRELLEQA